MNTKIEALKNNVAIINNVLATFDFSVLDPRDVPTIKDGFEHAKVYCEICIDYENGVCED